MVYSIINHKKSVSRINRLLLFIIFVVICIYLASLITLRSINKAFGKYGILGKCFIIFMGVLFVLNIVVILRWFVNYDNIEGLLCPPFTVDGVNSNKDTIMLQSIENPFMAPFGYTCPAGHMGPIPSARNYKDQSLIKNAAIVQSTGKAQGVYDAA